MSTRRRRTTAALTAATATLIGAAAVTAMAGPTVARAPVGSRPDRPAGRHVQPLAQPQRPGQLVADLTTGTNAQAHTVAEIIQRAHPDIVLLNEFDYVADGRRRPVPRQLPRGGQNGATPSSTPTRSSRRRTPASRAASTSTTTAGRRAATTRSASARSRASTAWSCCRSTRSTTDEVRTFQNFLWKDMPGALLPDDPATAAPADWYSPEELDVFRLRASRTGTCPSRSAGTPCTSSRRTRRRRRSTAPRTATAAATTTRSGSGPTTSTPGRPPLHLRRRGRARRAAPRRRRS